MPAKLNEELQQQFDQLNSDQHRAVQTLDGPVLVVAGPGTGKTQLLGLRAANILASRDVSPRNILCLTYTEAGAQAMTQRLARFIGSEAYQVTIATFHSFASGLRSRYPEYFTRGTLDTLISPLQSARLINTLLKSQPNGDALYQPSFNGVHGALPTMQDFITRLKRSGLSPADFRTLIEQNLACMDAVAEQTDILQRIGMSLVSGSFDSRCQALDELQELICQLPTTLAPSLSQPLVATPGIYQPLACFLAERFAQAELYDPDAKKTRGFQELRDLIFAKDEQGLWVFKDRKACEKALSALGLYQRYQAHLEKNALFDYDDMILDAIAAIEGSAELRHNLQEQYRYIQVDEYQDTNGVQMRLLDLLAAGDAPNILVVGDDDQAIMRFQGASVTYINQFEQHYAQVTRCVLKINYRSTPSLVELGQHLARQIETRSAASQTEKNLCAHRSEFVEGAGVTAGGLAGAATGTASAAGGFAGTAAGDAMSSVAGTAGDLASGTAGTAGAAVLGAADTATGTAGAAGQFVAEIYPTKELQYYAVAQAIAQAIDGGFIQNSATPNEAIAVIAPTHAGLRGLIPYLKQFSVPFNYTYTTAVNQIGSLQNLLALLALLAEYSRAREGYAEARMPQVMAAPELGLEPGDYIGLALTAKRQGISWLEALRGSEQPRLRELHDWLEQLIASAAASPVRQLISQAALPFVRYWQARQETEPYALAELNFGLKALLDFAQGELDSAQEGTGTAQGELGFAQSNSGGQPAVPLSPARDEPNSALQPLRLADLIERFAEADRYKITIDAVVPVARQNAITLTTAHSSKGLEYDRVYLIDADDSSWHPGNRGGALLPQNMLFGSIRDEDDARRLLFVAVTRARFQLRASHGGKDTIRELSDVLEEQKIQLDLDDVVALSEQIWQDNYRLDGEELQALLRPSLEQIKLSASRLNAFVEYLEGGTNSSEFINSNLLSLPGQPSAALEFGTLVHAFLEDYLNHVYAGQADGGEGQLAEGESQLVEDGSQSSEDSQSAQAALLSHTANLALEQLVAQTHQRIARLDCEPTELEHLHQRFDLVVSHFLPQLPEYLNGRLVTESWVNAEVAGIPLVGKCDLLVLDDEQKTIHVFDYKTTQKAPEKPSTAYIRQLQFYRLLLENSPDFAGYRVVGSADLLVEPLRDRGYQLHPPQFFATSDEQLERLGLLIQAVWYRIQNELFDTTAFEDSEIREQLLAANVKADGSPRKRLDKQQLQEAYEQWLIEDWQQRVGGAADAVPTRETPAAACAEVAACAADAVKAAARANNGEPSS